jgi:ATP-dependent RNA helicase RhlE
VSADEAGLLADIERLIGAEIPRQDVPGFEPLSPVVTKGKGVMPGKPGKNKTGGQSRSGRPQHGQHQGRGEKKPHWHRRSGKKQDGGARRGNSR